MENWASVQLSQGACLVVNNAMQAIYKARRMILTARSTASDHGRTVQFMLTIDEADDFYRTSGGDAEIKMETQMRKLKKLGPLVQFEVTATLLAIYMQLMRFGQADEVPAGDIFYVESSLEYVDARMLVPPEDANGVPQFFTSEKDLNNNNTYADPKVRSVWKRAAEHNPPPGGYGSLLLDCTTSAVRAGGRTVGIYDKAREVMKQHPECIAIIVSGAEIAWCAINR